MIKRKIYLKFGILFFGVSLIIYGCQKEDTVLDEKQAIEQTQHKFSVLSGNKIPSHITNYLNNKTNSTMRFNLSGKRIEPITTMSNYAREANLEIGTVNTTKSIKVVNDNNTK